MDVVIENVRCFSGSHRCRISPLTVLVGENSAGKSTFLAVLSAICNQVNFPFQPRFNDAPYNLGSYDTIATYKGGRFGRAAEFTIGFSLDKDENRHTMSALATYNNHRGQPRLAHYVVESGENRFEILLIDGSDTYSAELAIARAPGEARRVKLEMNVPEIASRPGYFILDQLVHGARRGLSDPPLSLEELEAIDRALFRGSPMATLSIAPMRTKPKRTYDQMIERYSVEGDDIPFILEAALAGDGKRKQNNDIMEALQSFGEESGLFAGVKVKRLGRQPSDPIQVMVTVAGKAANLIDVGYGVSQALPVIIRSVMSGNRARLLLQQPEVHLHPRSAQAALGSFFANLVSSNKQAFVIETHSDYILDRIRQEVASGKLDARQVAIIFFDKEGPVTNIYNIDLDAQGNIINAPSCYRDFFMQESLAFLQRGLS